MTRPEGRIGVGLQDADALITWGMSAAPEPWLRGPLPGVKPLVAPVLHSFAQVREDLARHTRGTPEEGVWRRIGSLPSLGFHLRHIAGSVDRLTAYLMEEPLTPKQLEFLKREAEPGATLEELLTGVDEALDPLVSGYKSSRFSWLEGAGVSTLETVR